MIRNPQATALSGHPYGDPNGWCRDVADPFLTRHGPPVRTRLRYGGEGWMVTRLNDVRLVLFDRRFSSALAAAKDTPRVTTVAFTRVNRVAQLDPPEHTRLRRLFNNPFSAPRVRALQPWVEQYVADRISQIMAAGPPADLIRDLFDPVTLHLVSDIMGVGLEDRHRVRLQATVHQTMAMSRAETEELVRKAGSYFDDLVQQRRRHPGDDAISEALQIRGDRGDAPTDADVASLAMGLFTTGVEALSAQLQIGTHALLSHPEEMARLRTHPELMPNAVEEIIRYTPFLVGGSRARCAAEDVEVGGVLLRAGDFVLPNVSATNFDPDVVPDPYRLDLSRPRLPSIPFGFGAHFCQAAQLCRMVMSTVLSVLVQRPPDLRMAVPDTQLRWRKSRIRAFEELPVSW